MWFVSRFELYDSQFTTKGSPRNAIYIFWTMAAIMSYAFDNY